MDANNKELLTKVINNRLEKALAADPEKEENRVAFKEAMDALSKQIELDKLEASNRELIKKMEMEEKQNLRAEIVKIEEAKKERFLQIGLFVGGAVVAPIVERWIKTGYAKMLCEFEKDYTFTTTAGRALSGLFRSKK